MPRERSVGQLCWVTLGLGWPKFLAWAATAVALLLAVLPGGVSGGDYHAPVALGAATVVAAVWAGFFAFRSIHPPAAVELHLDIENRSSGVSLHPDVRNPTRRAMLVKPFLHLWLVHEDSKSGERSYERVVSHGSFYDGAWPKLLGPRDGFVGNVNLKEYFRVELSPKSGAVRHFGPKEVRVRFWVEWTDDLCEAGRVEPKHWVIEIGGDESGIVDPHRVEEFFGVLPESSKEVEGDGGQARRPGRTGTA